MVIEAKLRKIFSGAKTNLLLIKNSDEQDPNFKYLTGFTSGTFEDNFLIASRKKVSVLTSELEYETALSQAKEGVEVINALGSKKDFKKAISVIKGKSIGVNGNFLSFNDYNKIKKFKPSKIIDVSENLIKARLIKSAEEIANIRKAVSITKFAIMEVQKSIKAGMTELEVAAQVDFVMKSLGASGNSFDTIVAFGKNTALPHHMPDQTKLNNGDLVLIDTGAKYNNYCADITRTFVYGKANKRAEEMIKFVKKVQLMAIHMLKPGVDAYAVEKKIRKYIDSYNGGVYKGKFIHALGHGIGLEVHDASVFGNTPYRKIKKGMTLAVEPGIYLVGFGGVRVEDDILIDKNGAIVL